MSHVADRNLFLKTAQIDPEPAGIAHQPEHLGQPVDRILAQPFGGRLTFRGCVRLSPNHVCPNSPAGGPVAAGRSTRPLAKLGKKGGYVQQVDGVSLARRT